MQNGLKLSWRLAGQSLAASQGGWPGVGSAAADSLLSSYACSPQHPSQDEASPWAGSMPMTAHAAQPVPRQLSPSEMHPEREGMHRGLLNCPWQWNLSMWSYPLTPNCRIVRHVSIYGQVVSLAQGRDASAASFGGVLQARGRRTAPQAPGCRGPGRLRPARPGARPVSGASWRASSARRRWRPSTTAPQSPATRRWASAAPEHANSALLPASAHAASHGRPASSVQLHMSGNFLISARVITCKWRCLLPVTCE